MGDAFQNIGGTSSSADFLEWNFTIQANGTPWSIEEAMTQLLAYENAEGFTLPLATAMQRDGEVIHELGRRRKPTAVAALRAFAAMSTVDTQRELARTYADKLVAEGLPEPPWVDQIGRVRVDGCWWAHDPFDETAIVLCAFSYDGADEHGILAMIDRTLGGGLFRELTLGTRPAEWLETVLTPVSEGFVGEPLDPAYARRLFEDAVATSDELIENREYQPRPVPRAYRKMRALTLARARALADAPVPAESFPGTVELELLKRSFLASGAASALPGDDATDRALDLLVTQFVEQAACHPLQLGPRRVQAILGLPALATDAAADPEVARLLPEVAGAWISWTAVERGLPVDAVERLGRITEQSCADLRAAIAGGAKGA
ncbi:hypothetical protein ACN27G_10540 [Plantactinospora sp. WMMB334]|uniref:hypothetical protein n=1 Tax=Plantactinospora sp. WMMB334 TaxID=3404119 RepID=UPI003B9398B7